ncbi:MAG: SDR family NAD(P)-dependent oxidoreductase [Clostridia bacterium]|nr:SDR family NAD(P)-dependent oxidoreductase [Clostridia bacterium]
MNIAVVTGASSGIGKEFFLSLKDRPETLDEIWVIARNREKLEELKSLTDVPVRVIPLDLSLSASYHAYGALLEEHQPQIRYLICASGFGRFEAVENDDVDTLTNMVDLNCNGVVGITRASLPYMGKNSQMLVIASVAAFQPIPYIATYGATKAFVLSYCRALNRELKKRGSRCLAVCPFWTKTAFFDRALSENQVVKSYAAMYEPTDIVRHAWKAAKNPRRDYCIYGTVAKGQTLLTKLLPHRLVMNVWMGQQKLK